MHAETFAYLLHNLNGKGFRPGFEPDPTVEAPPVEDAIIQIPAGFATLGQCPNQFGWDNEFPRHSVEVPAFSVSK